MAGISAKLNDLAAKGDAENINTTLPETKHPHVSAGVMLWLDGKVKSESNFKKAFSEVVTELQRKSYLKKGTLTSTGKGVRLVRMLEKSAAYYELMEEYEDLLKKFRKGKDQPYKGPVPLR